MSDLPDTSFQVVFVSKATLLYGYAVKVHCKTGTVIEGPWNGINGIGIVLRPNINVAYNIIDYVEVL